MWFFIPTAVVAGIGEILGWSARYCEQFFLSLSERFSIDLDRVIANVSCEQSDPVLDAVSTAEPPLMPCAPLTITSHQNLDYDHRAHTSRCGQLHHPGNAHQASWTTIQPHQS